jgi:hypothetical protein
MDIYREEDLRLCRHLPVIACWSEGGFSHQARGIIHTLDSRTVAVKLLEDLGNRGNRGKYARGALLVLPRFADQTAWSSTLGVRLCPEKSRRRRR